MEVLKHEVDYKQEIVTSYQSIFTIVDLKDNKGKGKKKKKCCKKYKKKSKHCKSCPLTC